MSTTDQRSTERRSLDRIAAARAHRPAVDAQGHPLPDQPGRRYIYGAGGTLERVEIVDENGARA